MTPDDRCSGGWHSAAFLAGVPCAWCGAVLIPSRAYYLRRARAYVRQAREERDRPRTMSAETRDAIREQVRRRVEDSLILARHWRARARDEAPDLDADQYAPDGGRKPNP